MEDTHIIDHEPIPQVGAVLYFDSELEYKSILLGNKHWTLAGSCVLVKPDLILTVGHVLGTRFQADTARGDYAVFFPYEGLFKVDGNPKWEPQVPGDNLALVQLEGVVERWVPLRPRENESRYKEKGKARVCGYGSWPGSETGRLEGVQQQHEVNLGKPTTKSAPRWGHYDNLDLSWSSHENGGKVAGRGNSGGPMLWSKNGSLYVVGISREVKEDQQAGSWIGVRRKDWLGKILASHEDNSQTPQRQWQLLNVGRNGEVIPFEVPPGATKVQATLNASQGLRLQMGIDSAAVPQDLLDRLRSDDSNSGQFLFRSRGDLPKGTKKVAIGICPVERAPRKAESVYAQLCVLFT